MTRSVQYSLSIALCFILLVPAVGAAQQGHPNPFTRPDGFAPSIQALVTTDKGLLYAGSFGMGMFLSGDQGATWESVNSGLDDKFILCLASDPRGIVYTGTVRGGIFRTKEDGKTWESINKGLKRVEVKSLLADTRGIYAGTGRGVYKWDESGKQWIVAANGLDQTLVSSLVMLDNQRLFAGTAGKGLLSLDTTKPGRAVWERIDDRFVDPKEHLIHNHIRIVAVGPNQHIYAGTQNGGLYRSQDLGKSWDSIGRSLPNDSIRSIVPTNLGLFVGTGRGVFKSTLRDRKWAGFNSGLTELAIQVLTVSDQGDLYVGTSAGAFRSGDHGNHWENISGGLGIQFKMPRPYF
ncbi:MAG: hypothetical protein VST68_05245 [Nitrospirota bacterium]|nr:hypothetical protein [Nitrospirota bacterium]